MTPDRQAQLLADWLQQEPGAEPHEELDSDAVEAVYALRPDLAPAPRLTIEDVLAEVREGPFAAEDARAVTALVDWLEDNPGADPPADVDPDVVEAVYALRPDLAPPPRVDMDDIFGAVTTGPFAVDASTPKTSEGGQVVSLAAARAQPRVDAAPVRVRRPAARWLVPGLGGLAVAAVALMLVLPASQQVLDAPTPFSASETVASKPAAEPTTADAVDTGAVKQGPHKSVRRTVRSPAADPAPAAARSVASKESAAAAPQLEEEFADELIPIGPRGAGSSASTGTDVGDLASANKQEAAGPTAAPAAEPESRSSAMREQAEEAPARQAPAEHAAAYDEDAFEEPALDDAERSRDEVDSTVAETESLSTAGRRERKDARPGLLPTMGKKKAMPADAPATVEDFASSDDFADAEMSGMELDATVGGMAESAPAAAAPPPAPSSTPQGAASSTRSSSAAASAPATSAPTGSTALDLDALRNQAWPLGASPDVTIGRPDVAAAHAAAAQADAQGDQALWLAAMQPLLAHGDAVVAQDAAVRIARRQLSLGQARAALGTVEVGLRRGDDGALAARLYTLQGQAWERLGAAESAAGSYQRAIQAR